MKTYQDSEGRPLPTQWEALHAAEDHRRQVVSDESRGGPSVLPCGHAIAGGSRSARCSGWTRTSARWRG